MESKINQQLIKYQELRNLVYEYSSNKSCIYIKNISRKIFNDSMYIGTTKNFNEKVDIAKELFKANPQKYLN